MLKRLYCLNIVLEFSSFFNFITFQKVLIKFILNINIFNRPNLITSLIDFCFIFRINTFYFFTSNSLLHLDYILNILTISSDRVIYFCFNY